MESLKSKALSLGASDFGVSNNKNKKYYVVYNNKKIHFGHSLYSDYTQHNDPERRRRYLARARGIKNKKGELTSNDKNSGNYWAINLLW